MSDTAQRTVTYLLAEDNDDHAQIIERCFRYGNLPSEICRVRSGAECLNYLAGEGPFADRAQHPYPQVVLLDIRMPGILDGLQTLQAIRSDPRHRRLLVMMLTTSERDLDVSRAYEMGANGYVVKSNDTNRMIDKLRQVQQAFCSVVRFPEQTDAPPPKFRTRIGPEPLPAPGVEALLDSDEDAAFQELVSAYRKDRDETLRLLRTLERVNGLRFASLVCRFCAEQRSLFAGSSDIDWVFLQKVVMEQLPRHVEAGKMAGLVAGVSAVLEGNDCAESHGPVWHAWQGFSQAYMNQGWSLSSEPPEQTHDKLGRSSAFWARTAVAALIVSLAGILVYFLWAVGV